MAPRQSKLAYHVICDDIRQEVGNKLSLMGIYPRDAIALPIPSVIPKLCFHFVFSYTKPGSTFRIQLIDPEGNKLLSIDKIEIPKKPRLTRGILDAQFTGLKISKEGIYLLSIYADGAKQAFQEIKIQIKKA